MHGYLYMYTCLISSDEFIRLEDGSWLDLSRRKVAAIERFQRAKRRIQRPQARSRGRTKGRFSQQGFIKHGEEWCLKPSNIWGSTCFFFNENGWVQKLTDWLIVVIDWSNHCLIKSLELRQRIWELPSGYDFHSLPWKDPPFLRTVNHLFLWAIYTMAMLVITRGYMSSQHGCHSYVGCHRIGLLTRKISRGPPQQFTSYGKVPFLLELCV